MHVFLVIFSEYGKDFSANFNSFTGIINRLNTSHDQCHGYYELDLLMRSFWTDWIGDG